MEVNIHKAKTHFSRLLQRVAEGEEVTIARAGVPVARLVRVEAPSGFERPMGMDRGTIEMADDFDAPLPDELMRLFVGASVKTKAKVRAAKKRGKPA
jgi:prevent-host-death family protein